MPQDSHGLVNAPGGSNTGAPLRISSCAPSHLPCGEMELVKYPEKQSIADFPDKTHMSKEASYPGGISFPSWQSDVQAAVNEANPEMLLARVHTAEISIFNRLQELGKFPAQDESHQRERESLAEALETLRRLKRDRLGFPDWTQK